MTIGMITQQDLVDFKISVLSEIKDILESYNSISNNSMWLRSADVQKILSCSASTLQNLRTNESLPYTKLAGTLYYSIEDIMRILEENYHSTGHIKENKGIDKTIHTI